MITTAVVGHVEWVTFARVDHTPQTGEIVHASDSFSAPAGGGPVAAVQLRKLAGNCRFFTALGDDPIGRCARRELRAMGLRVEAATRREPQRTAFAHVDAKGERTITVMGERLGPRATDRLPWRELASTDGVYFCAGDDEALRIARNARVLVATSREAERLARVGVRLDAVVGSARDPSERYVPVDPPPGVVVSTLGPDGARFTTSAGRTGSVPAAPLPGPLACTYGAGDSFAAGLTYGLAAGMSIDAALGLAARCGAACLTGRGPYEGQLSAP